MIRVYKHEIDCKGQHTFLVYIKIADIANYAMILKDNLFEDFMIDEFACLIAKHELDDAEIEIHKGEIIQPFRLHELLLN